MFLKTLILAAALVSLFPLSLCQDISLNEVVTAFNKANVSLFYLVGINYS